jgi:Mn-dependent DtxR family transcriptional regulator
MVTNRKVGIEELKQISAFIEKKWTYAQIAEELKVTPKTVQRWARKMRNAGVKLNITMGPKPLL